VMEARATPEHDESEFVKAGITLRTPDAINIAIAQRIGATLVTFDEKMAAVAALLGLSVTGM
jgi:predicted nucleic acid-binding protein